MQGADHDERSFLMKCGGLKQLYIWSVCSVSSCYIGRIHDDIYRCWTGIYFFLEWNATKWFKVWPSCRNLLHMEVDLSWALEERNMSDSAFCWVLYRWFWIWFEVFGGEKYECEIYWEDWQKEKRANPKRGRNKRRDIKKGGVVFAELGVARLLGYGY